MRQEDGGGFVTMREHGPVQRGQASTGPGVAIGTIFAKQLRQLSMIMYRGFMESRQTCYDRQCALGPRFTSFRLHVQEHRTASEQLLDEVDVAKPGGNQQAYSCWERVGDRWALLLQDVSHDIDQLIFEPLASIVEPLFDSSDGYVQKCRNIFERVPRAMEEHNDQALAFGQRGDRTV